jgi:hypothetical protein
MSESDVYLATVYVEDRCGDQVWVTERICRNSHDGTCWIETELNARRQAVAPGAAQGWHYVATFGEFPPPPLPLHPAPDRAARARMEDWSPGSSACWSEMAGSAVGEWPAVRAVRVIEPDVLLGWCRGEAESFVAWLAGVLPELVGLFDGMPEPPWPGFGDAIPAVRRARFDESLRVVLGPQAQGRPSSLVPRLRCMSGKCHCARKPSNSPSRSSGFGSTSVTERVGSSSLQRDRPVRSGVDRGNVSVAGTGSTPAARPT